MPSGWEIVRALAAPVAGIVAGAACGLVTVETGPGAVAAAAGCGVAAGAVVRGTQTALDGGGLTDVIGSMFDPKAMAIDAVLGGVISKTRAARTPVGATEAGSVRNVNPLGGTNNCVNCAVATDATLSGAPSSALNVAPGVTGQPILEDLYGGAFKPVSGQAGIASILTEAGPGSRGIVFGARGSDVGHVFNAVNQNGTIRFLDGQTGGVASFKGYTDFWFLPTG